MLVILNISAKAEPTISSLNLNNLNDCKENLPPLIPKATNSGLHVAKQ